MTAIKQENNLSRVCGELIYSEGARRFLAPYASIPENSRGRLLSEESRAGSSPYQRDRDRIIHATAFRRLEYKTQVFINNEGDHYRTRLTHTLEVAQLSRSIARELALDEDISEAIALAHDLGHPPFGHAGEDALAEVMCDYGGYDHNAQSIRLLTKLESKYKDFDGLNLTWETLEGIAKHNGPVTNNIPRALAEFNKKYDMELNTYPNLEAQISATCDDIAYNNHDIEDGIRAKLFDYRDIQHLPIVGDIISNILDIQPDIEQSRLIHEVKRKSINLMVQDLLNTTISNVKEQNIQSVKDVRNANKFIANFSDEMLEDCQQIKKFLRENMYRHYKVNIMTSKARRVIKDLFEFYMAETSSLPENWFARIESNNKPIIIADYIAGMTDRYALEEHRKIFDTSYKLI